MSLHQNIADVDATLTFTGSVRSLAQILAAFPGGSLTLATVIAADASSSPAAAGGTAKTAGKTTAKSADSHAEREIAGEKSSSGNADAKQDTPAADPASSGDAGSQSEAGQTATSTASPSEGNGQAGSLSEQATASAGKSDVTYEQVAQTILKVVSAKGREAAVAIFTDFGVPNARELKPEQWADCLAAAELALAA